MLHVVWDLIAHDSADYSARRHLAGIGPDGTLPAPRKFEQPPKATGMPPPPMVKWCAPRSLTRKQHGCCVFV
jgi:hypothetical protein